MKGLLIFLLFPLLTYSQIQFSGSQIGGGSQDDVARKIRIDSEGNHFVLGSFVGPAIFGAESVQGFGFTDIYFQKVDSNGEIIWTKSIGGPNTEVALAIAVNGNNNIWISGKYTGTIDLDPSVNAINITSVPTNGFDCFLACYNGQTGEYITHKDLSSGGILEVRDIEFTENQQVIIGGTFQFTVDFDFSNATLFKTSFVNSFDGFVANYSADFETINWVNVLNSGNPALDNVNDISILNNKIFITGLVAGTMDIDPGNSVVQLIGATDAFLISYNVNNGSLNWGFKLGGNSLELGNRVSIINNRIYLSGTLNSNNVDFNPGNATNILSANGLNSPAFIAEYDTLGNYITAFLMDIAATGTYSISAIKPSENNEILVSGSFKGEMDVDPSAAAVIITSQNVNNSFILWLDQNDSLINYKVIESIFDNTVNDIIFSQSKVIAIGALENTCSPDQTLNVTVNGLFASNSDAFIFNYSPNVTLIENLVLHELTIFPNPINAHSIVSYYEDLKLDLMDITGNKCGSIRTNMQCTLFNELPKGIYFAVNAEKNLFLKFLKVD